MCRAASRRQEHSNDPCKNAKKATQGASSDNAKLSMRAAREAQNGLAVTLTNLNASTDGLTELEAQGRLARNGHNEVAHDKPPHALIQLLKALNNPFIYVLLTLAAISFSLTTGCRSATVKRMTPT